AQPARVVDPDSRPGSRQLAGPDLQVDVLEAVRKRDHRLSGPLVEVVRAGQRGRRRLFRGRGRASIPRRVGVSAGDEEKAGDSRQGYQGPHWAATSIVLMVSPTWMAPTTSAPELTAPKWL